MTTIAAAELHHMLGQVLPHMSEDITLPVINSVHIEARDGYLFASATDRYTMGIARTAITTSDRWTNVFIPAEHIPTVNSWLEATIGTVTLTVIRDEDEATLVLTGKSGTLRIDYDGRSYRHLPNWRTVLRDQLNAEPQLVPLTGFTTKYLARWEKAASVLQGWQYGAYGALVLMDEMGGFLGMQMPVRHEISRDDLVAKWRGSLARYATVDGQEYNLESRWADEQGDPWEYTGRDRFGEPLMRLVGIDDDDHTLAAVIATFGPLSPIIA